MIQPSPCRDGCTEIERALKLQQARRWDRLAAINLWKSLKRCPEGEFNTDQVVELGSKLKLDSEQALEIVDAFLETDAIKDVGGRFQFGQANGMKLEHTQAFCRGGAREAELKKVRAFFSGPRLAERLTEKWPWLAEAIEPALL